LYADGQEVVTKRVALALVDFLEFLERHENVVLVFHNAPFDLRFLRSIMEENGFMARFQAAVVGFVDTLPAARNLVPKKILKERNLTALARHFLGEVPAGLHSASTDVEVLKAVSQHMLPTREDYFPFSYKFADYLNFGHLCESAAAMESLLEFPFMTSPLVFKFCKEGANLETLKNWSRHPLEEFSRHLLPIVPKMKANTVESLYNFLQDR
jgi:DNA polymerase III epsilon subunit-like protein